MDELSVVQSHASQLQPGVMSDARIDPTNEETETEI
jgi:hypothetical protein